MFIKISFKNKLAFRTNLIMDLLNFIGEGPSQHFLSVPLISTTLLSWNPFTGLFFIRANPVVKKPLNKKQQDTLWIHSSSIFSKIKKRWNSFSPSSFLQVWCSKPRPRPWKPVKPYWGLYWVSGSCMAKHIFYWKIGSFALPWGT